VIKLSNCTCIMPSSLTFVLPLIARLQVGGVCGHSCTKTGRFMLVMLSAASKEKMRLKKCYLCAYAIQRVILSFIWNMKDSDSDHLRLLYRRYTVPTTSLCDSWGQEPAADVTYDRALQVPYQRKKNMFRNAPNCDILTGQGLSML
jgi:hypothetical protein